MGRNGSERGPAGAGTTRTHAASRLQARVPGTGQLAWELQEVSGGPLAGILPTLSTRAGLESALREVREFKFKFSGPLAFAQARVDSESAARAARGPAWSLPTPRPSLPDSADLGSEPGGGGDFARAAAGVLGSRPAAWRSAVGPERPGGGTEVKDSQKVSGGSD